MWLCYLLRPSRVKICKTELHFLSPNYVALHHCNDEHCTSSHHLFPPTLQWRQCKQCFGDVGFLKSYSMHVQLMRGLGNFHYVQPTCCSNHSTVKRTGKNTRRRHSGTESDTVEWSEFKIMHDRQCTYKCNTESYSRTNCCRGKAISIVNRALVIWYEKHMRHVTLTILGVASPLCEVNNIRL